MTFFAGLRLMGNGGSYAIEGAIGQGGFGVVFQALRNDGVRVAIKTLAEVGHEARARFVRELRLMVHLQHPNIVPVLDCGITDQGHPWYAMPVMHESLAALLNRPRTWEEILAVVAGVADGLAYYHQRNGMHRDVKPENILLDRAGVPKLADFGIARCAEITGSRSTTSACGTEAYMAPEVWQNRACPASDIYSLGIVLWELANGRRHEVPARPPVLRTGHGGLGVLERLYSAMTVDNPEERPPAVEVAAHCRSILLSLQAVPRRPAVQRNPVGQVFKGLAVVGVVGLVGVAVARILKR